jgi:hypothetical protein
MKTKVNIQKLYKSYMENFNISVSPKEKKSLKFMVVSMTRNENGGKAQSPYS